MGETDEMRLADKSEKRTGRKRKDKTTSPILSTPTAFLHGLGRVVSVSVPCL
jgi:hypothetical protein